MLLLSRATRFAALSLPSPRTIDRALCALLLLLLVQAAALGQEGTATLSGRVVDATNGAPVGFASVVIENVDSGETSTGALTGEDGRFVVQGLEPAEYKVWTSFPGYLMAEADLLVGELNQSYDLGDVHLVPLASFEDQVTVTAEAIRAAGLDTQVFQLDDGPAQTTGSLLDAMKNLPGVTVDQDGRVSLRGSDRVAILIDGRQSSLTGFGSQRGLDSVSAANIEAIEIINNPSARFDAAGMAGIINIIYKREEELGFSGDVGLAIGNGQFSKQREDLPTDLGSFSHNPKIIPSLNLNHNTETVRSFVQGEILFQDDLPNNEFTTRLYDDGRVIESQVPENREQTHYIVRLGSDWSVDDTNTFSVSGIYDFETHTDRAQVPFILGATGERERFWFWREQEDTGFANIGFDFKHQFSASGHELSANLQYTRGWEDESYFLNEVSRVREGTDMTRLDAVENTLPLSIDYTRPLRSGRLELGTRLQRRWLPITYTVNRGAQSVIYEGLGDFSDWDEEIFALYGNLVHEKPTYSLEAGVRIEQTAVSYTIPEENIYYEGSDSYDYFEVFPNVKFTYRPTRANRLVAAYNRRVDRPGEPELRIFPKYDDPELLKVGNPFLRPQFTNAFEVGVGRSWASGSVSTALLLPGHQRLVPAPLRHRRLESELRHRQPDLRECRQLHPDRGGGPAGTRDRRSVACVRQRQLVQERHRRLRDDPCSSPRGDRSPWPLRPTIPGNFTLNNQIQLPSAIELQLSYVYYDERNVPQGRERSRSSVDIAATRPIMNERVELLFTFTDIFNDFAVEREIDGQGFTALYQNFLETQVATLGLRVRF